MELLCPNETESRKASVVERGDYSARTPYVETWDAGVSKDHEISILYWLLKEGRYKMWTPQSGPLFGPHLVQMEVQMVVQKGVQKGSRWGPKGGPVGVPD